MLNFIDLSTNRKIRPVEWWGCIVTILMQGEKSLVQTCIFYLLIFICRQNRFRFIKDF